MRFNVSALHEECEDMFVESLYIVCGFSDNSGSGWRPVDFVIKDMSAGVDLALSENFGTINAQSFWLNSSVTLEAGSSRTLSVWADTSGASSEEDDNISCFVNPEGWVVGDEGGRGPYNVRGPTVLGGAIGF